MKTPTLVPILLALAACGIPEGDFTDRYGERFCEEQVQCNADLPCEEDAGIIEQTEACDYDPRRAKDCLNADFVCDDSVKGGVIPPEVCIDVWDCSGATQTQ